MGAVLVKAGVFVVIIVLGYLLKRKGFFQKEDFYTLSKIVIKITLPAAIVFNFSKISMDISLLFLCGIGFLCNVLLVLIGYFINWGKSREAKAFGMINVSGYNIGNFTMPFVQNFLGPVGFAATSLFDAGNAVMCTGLTFAFSSAVLGTGERTTVSSVLKKLFSSIPFDAYVVMTVLAVCNITLPSFVLNFAEVAGNANTFLALLAIGIGFEIRLDRTKIATALQIIATRYGLAILMSLAFYFLAPFSLEVRQTLAIVVLGPVSSVSPAFSGVLGLDVELSSVINSLSILMSIVMITAALLILL